MSKNRAKYYIYRNLHKDTFSIRYKGRVIEHADFILAKGVTYKVNQAGREQVLRERKKAVHAFVVCDSYQVLDPAHSQGGTSLTVKDICNEAYNYEAYYNPYKQPSFTLKGYPIHKSKVSVLGNNKVWVSHTEAQQLNPAIFLGID